MNIKCLLCGKPFSINQGSGGHNRIYCSSLCRHRASRKMALMRAIFKRCPVCHKEFKPENGKQKYCSQSCNQNDKRISNRLCVICGRSFVPHSRNKQCCSKACAKKKETITKRLQADSYRLALGHEISALILRPITTLNNWRYVEWRTKVYERDNYTCQCCGDNRGNDLNAHHLNSYSRYPESRLSIENGVTLCNKCHRAYHRQYGYRTASTITFEIFKAEHITAVKVVA